MESAEWVLVGLGVATLCLSAVIAAVTATWVIGRGNKASADTAEKLIILTSYGNSVSLFIYLEQMADAIHH